MGMEGSAGAGSAIIASAAELEAASLGFHRAFPRRSAKRTFHVTQAIWLVAVLAGLVASFHFYPLVTGASLYALAIFVFAAFIFTRLLAAARLSDPPRRLAQLSTWPTYTVLCPLYREANVVSDLIAALLRLDYPPEALDIKILVEADDEQTIHAALAAAVGKPIEVIALPPARPRTKPKALNVGLARARGEYLVVYDAEDRPHPKQLRAALAAFAEGGAQLACVQAPLDIDNPEAAWITRQFATEYAIQFHQILPMLADLKLPLPLGGSSNHFRTEALRDVGGWDPFNVTEDADIGYRLARNGMRSGAIAFGTNEEAPITLTAWFNQRTRWIKGHMQTWLVLMRNPFRTAKEMGLGAFLAMHLILSGGIAAAFAHGPLACIVAIAALSPVDLLKPADFSLALFGYCVAAFAALSASAQTGSLGHLRAALTMPFYWPLSSLAAARALLELLFRPHHWSKTDHGCSPRPDVSAL